jgi:hypothetical protein
LASSTEDSIKFAIYSLYKGRGKKTYFSTGRISDGIRKFYSTKIPVGTNNIRTFPVLGHMALWLRIAPTTMHASTEWRKRGTTQGPLIDELQHTLINTTAQLTAKIISVMAFSLSVSLALLSLSCVTTHCHAPWNFCHKQVCTEHVALVTLIYLLYRKAADYSVLQLSFHISTLDIPCFLSFFVNPCFKVFSFPST